ncbi:MAG: hypothetical protein HYT12_03785 [Candidatus Liptonbacteria bacterium]|nr:hypothetical protein [Candidatus Liptonbacteria bacterium]
MEPRRIGKQFLYGIFYTTFFFAIIYAPYFILKPEPTCFDGKQNQDEAGVDCGGASCMSCEIKSLKPIEVVLRTSFLAQDPVILVKLENPNTRFGALKLPYQLDVYGASGNIIKTFKDETFIYPGDKEKYIVKQLDGAGSVVIGSPKITLGDPVWESVNKFRKPNFTFRQVNSDVKSGEIFIRGNIKNEETLLFTQVDIGALFYSINGTLLGVSKTQVRDVKAFEERFFQIEYPISAAPNVDLTKTRLFYEAVRQ